MASAAPPAPQVQVTQPTPRTEKPEFIDSETLSSYKQAGDNDVPQEYNEDDQSNSDDYKGSDAISSPPKPHENMAVPVASQGSGLGGRSSFTLSEAGSGYERDTNECSEFFLDCFSCFGLFDACCPSDSDGCITSCAVFFGNLCFACCRCK